MQREGSRDLLHGAAGTKYRIASAFFHAQPPGALQRKTRRTRIAAAIEVAGRSHSARVQDGPGTWRLISRVVFDGSRRARQPLQS
jgi:hypothetical protein